MRRLGTLRLWLTRRPDGGYMLTRLRPVVARRKGSRESDVYEAVGEPIGVRHLCAEGIRAAGWVLQPLESRRVQFTLAPEDEESPMATEPRFHVRLVMEAVPVGEDFAPLTGADKVFSQTAHVWGGPGMSLLSLTAVQAEFKEFGGKLIDQSFSDLGGKPDYMAKPGK